MNLTLYLLILLLGLKMIIFLYNFFVIYEVSKVVVIENKIWQHLLTVQIT